MLNLTLRDEFVGDQMPGTAIALRRADNTGAAQQSADQILSITYPTADVIAALRALSEHRPKRPIVLMGDRGRGKSHIMGVMHHAIASPGAVESWAHGWEQRPGMQALSNLTCQRDFFAISEPVHNQEYPLLWDLLFDRHPKGDFFRGKFQQMNQPVPPRSLLEEMFQAQPVALILDEFQKWFDGLSDEPGAAGRKWREIASAFVQVLSEMAEDRPDILILVISVLNNNTEAFRQVHRNNPVLIDFRGPTAKQDRQRLVLHRLFKNRDHIPGGDVANLVGAYAGERFRLRHSHLSESERNRISRDVVDSWPFAPELLEVLEDHILMASAAQETRDLIRILASAYRARGEKVPLVTPADFLVDDDSCGVQSLLDSIATSGEQEALREIAQRNLQGVLDLGMAIPHARELISALWMRSMSPVKDPGGTRGELQLDLTRDAVQDDNSFRAELALLVENSLNIHGDHSADGRLYFAPSENARTKVRVTARNHKLWAATAVPSGAIQSTYPGKDIEHVRNTLRHILVPETSQPASRVIVLGPNWQQDPWSEVDEGDQPERWDRPVLIVVPVPVGSSKAEVSATLGKWLATHVPSKRNTLRFLLPSPDRRGIFEDEELMFAARCSYLSSIAWKDDAKYRALKEEFDKPLRDALKARYQSFGVLRRWHYREPSQCVFELEPVEAKGGDIPTAVEVKILSSLFEPEELERVVLTYAKELKSVAELLRDLSEPPPLNTVDAIPYLGETATYEEVLKIAAKGKLFLNVLGTWVGRQPDHPDDETALRAIRVKAFRSGPEMRQVQLGLPSAVGGTTIATPKTEPAATTTICPEPTLQQHEGTASQAGKQGLAAPAEPSPKPASPPKTRHSDQPTSGINLSGCFEQWGVSPDTTLESAKIELAGYNVQQVKQVLARLPSAIKATLEITYTDEDES